MTPELRRRAEQVFDEALSVELSRRSAFLDAACTDDPPGVRTEVESLLAHYEQAAAAGLLHEPMRKGVYGLDSPAVGEPTSKESPHVPPGYEFLGELGRGGMGVVYKVRQTSLNRLLALKMIRAGSLAHPEELARFRAEAEAVARFQHANLVQIYEVGQEQGRAYCTLEYVGGGSLAQKLSGKPLPVREAAALAETLARAVHYAHGHGILHRDLKPSNVLLTTEGVPKITDFGLAKRLDLDQGLTETGRGMGTPSYMAPEQAQGKKNVGVAADIYSLGAILYEMLSGRPPFVGVTPYEIIEQVKNHDPLPFLRLRIRVPRDLETICRKCLQKDPARRYASAEELADDLYRYQAGEPIRARPVGRIARLGRWCRRKPVVAGLIAALVLVFAGGVTAATREWIRAEKGWAKAEAEFLDHHQSVESFYQLATEDDRLFEPASQPLAKKWREAALTYFRRFLEQRGADPRLQAEIAQAHLRIAQMTDALGSKADALAEYEQAALQFEKLCADNPTEAKYQFELALTYQNRGILQGETKDRQKALASLDQARQLFQGLAQNSRDDTEARHSLSETLLNTARVQLWCRRLPEALDWTRQAVVILENLTDAHRDSVPFRFELANGYSQLGTLYHTLKQPEALKCYQKAAGTSGRTRRLESGTPTVSIGKGQGPLWNGACAGPVRPDVESRDPLA